MSSDYRIICLSHDPAIETEHEWHSRTGGREQMALALDGRDQAAVAGHRGCDLIGGRYSYPLIEVYCPSMPPDHPANGAQRGWHRDGKWFEAGWLRLALASWDLPGDPLATHLDRLPGCWPQQRLARLRPLLFGDGES